MIQSDKRGDAQFATVTLRDWKEIHDYARANWVYRGQREAGWPLLTSLDRCFENHDVRPSRLRWTEKRMLREFRRGYHQFSSDTPERGAILEWLALMQHYGTPTRLLDFSYSIYVAAYFALESRSTQKTNRANAVWAVNALWAWTESLASAKAAGKKAASVRLRPLEDDDEEAIGRLLMKKPLAAMAAPLTPFRLNERLRVQQGTFLAQGDISKSFWNNLAALGDSGDENNILKIIIPEGMRLEGLRRLWRMDISRASLFPGLDGFAASLGVNHSLFDATDWPKQ
jgi:hypothetical protein